MYAKKKKSLNGEFSDKLTLRTAHAIEIFFYCYFTFTFLWMIMWLLYVGHMTWAYFKEKNKKIAGDTVIKLKIYPKVVRFGTAVSMSSMKDELDKNKIKTLASLWRRNICLY